MKKRIIEDWKSVMGSQVNNVCMKVRYKKLTKTYNKVGSQSQSIVVSFVTG
jgi:hypothetical protein